MTVLITLTTAGADTGPFNIYSNVDGYNTPYATNISKSALLGGYPVVVPDATVNVSVRSLGACLNSVIIIPTGTTTTTTTL